MRLKDEGSSNPQDLAMSTIESAFFGSAKLAKAFASRPSDTNSITEQPCARNSR